MYEGEPILKNGTRNNQRYSNSREDKLPAEMDLWSCLSQQRPTEVQNLAYRTVVFCVKRAGF